MKNIPLLVSGLFLIGAFVWLRQQLNVASTAISVHGDLGVWKGSTTVGNAKGIARWEAISNPRGSCKTKVKRCQKRSNPQLARS